MKKWMTLVLALTLFVLSATMAQAHGMHHPRGMSEKQLRALETMTLGPEHAAKHAKRRAEMRNPQFRAAMKRRQIAHTATTRMAFDPSVSGSWPGGSSYFHLPVFAISSVVLPTSKVLIWAYPFGVRPQLPEEKDYAVAWEWDPSKGTFKDVTPCPTAIGTTAPMYAAGGCSSPTSSPNFWCAGQSLEANGDVLVMGGNLRYSTTAHYYQGLNQVWSFNPFTEKWTRHANMRHGRWYPTQTLLPDGRTLVTSGVNEEAGSTPADNLDVEVFDPKAPLGQEVALLGTRSATPDVNHPPKGAAYPHQFVMENGKLLFAGPYGVDSWLFDAPGDSIDWTDVPDYKIDRYAGSAVLLPGASQVMELGGGFEPNVTKTTSIIHEDGVESPGPSLNIARSFLNTVLLPDGSMATVGGGTNTLSAPGQWNADPSQKAIELYDPVTGKWTLGPSQLEFRAYHSTAVMLPDASILSAGDDENGVNLDSANQTGDGFTSDTGEVYQPNYFFKGARPTITSAADEIGAGDAFAVRTPDTITSAVLMAPGATTHANDMSQRRVEVDVTPSAGGVTIDTPANRSILIPGYYMLFIMNANGVPSVAHWIKVDATTPPLPPPAPPTADPVPAPSPDPVPAPVDVAASVQIPNLFPLVALPKVIKCHDVTIKKVRYTGLVARVASCAVAKRVVNAFRTYRTGASRNRLGYVCKSALYRLHGQIVRSRRMISCAAIHNRLIQWKVRV
jgi:hypothetical protein